MSNRKLTSEELKQKMMFLAGTTNINESVSKITNKNSKLLYHKKLADGRVYGIIQECQHYFVKVNSNPSENISVNDFAFIGGVNNALHEKFNSYFDAKNRINGKSISLNEAYGTYNVLNEECDKCKEEKEEEEEVLDEEVEKTPESSEKEDKSLDEEIPLNKDIDTKKVEAPVEVPVEAPVDAPVEAPVDAPVEAPVEAPVDTPSDMPMVDATDLKDYNPESGESTPSDASSDDEESGDTITDIQSLIGKLTQKLSTIDNIEPSLAKTTLNSVISATKTGIAQFTDKEKEDFKKRIETGGEKLDEEIANLMESNFGKRLLKKLIKEEVSLLKKKKSNLNESDDNKVSVKGGYYRFNPSTKTFQTTLVNKEGEPYPGEEFNKEEEAVSFLSASSLNESDEDLVSKAERSISEYKNKAKLSNGKEYYNRAFSNVKALRDINRSQFDILLRKLNSILSDNRDSLNEDNSIDNTYTHFAVRKSDNKIVNGWEYKDIDNESIKEYAKIDLKDDFPNNKLSDFKIVTKKSLENTGVNPFDTNNWYKIEELSEVKLPKLKFNKDYPIYHKLFGSALDSIKDYVNSAGYNINDQDFFTAFGDAFFKPKAGKTLRKTIEIENNEGEVVGNLHVQIYNRGTEGNTYELNMYTDQIIKNLSEEENVESVPNIRKNIKVTFNNGDSLTTEINGSEDEIKKYYIGKDFNLGIGGKDKMVKATNVEFL